MFVDLVDLNFWKGWRRSREERGGERGDDRGGWRGGWRGRLSDDAMAWQHNKAQQQCNKRLGAKWWEKGDRLIVIRKL